MNPVSVGEEAEAPGGFNPEAAAGEFGFRSFNPMQAHAIREGFLQAHSVVVAAPTASGKTLLAFLSIAKNFLEKGRKAVYIVPLKALANEKYDELSQAFEHMNARVGISTGDFDSSSENLRNYDVIVVTSEKMDSLLRHKAPWISEIGLAVADEIHLINDDDRGATLEVVLTKLLRQNIGIIGLSATIPNGEEVARWLNAKLITHDYRPVPLSLGICAGSKLYLKGAGGKQGEKLGEKPVEELVERCISSKPATWGAAGKENSRGGQALVFVSTRRGAESYAKAIARITSKFLGEEERTRLNDISRKVLGPSPTSQCRDLAHCISLGVAFHHAGVKNEQRKLIEQAFKKEHLLKAIACTTTLAMGVDYPASWVIVRDAKRFNGFSSEFIPKLEMQQMLGRSGRPRYDKEGIGVIACQQRDRREVESKYVYGPLENIYSKLGSEPALRAHCLALLAASDCRDYKSLFGFFNSTFFALQYGSAEELYERIEKVVSQLKDLDFVRERPGGVLVATPTGRRTSELYIDPLSAGALIDFARKCPEAPAKDFDYLLALTQATELRPLVNVRRNEEQALWDGAWAVLEESPAGFQGDAEALAKYKTAKLLNSWANEASEDEILKAFDVPPGILRARVSNAEWLAYSLSELAFMLNLPLVSRNARLVQRRIKHGVKEELLELCTIRGIGRMRARRLFAAGIKTVKDYSAAGKDRITEILRTTAI
jgi:helicase